MKKILSLIIFATIFSGCSNSNDLRDENERLRTQNRELRNLLQQTRKDTNRKQIRQLTK